MPKPTAPAGVKKGRGESRLGGDRGDRQLRGRQQFRGGADAHIIDELDRRLTEQLAKDRGTRGASHQSGRRDLRQRDLMHVMLLHEIDHHGECGDMRMPSGMVMHAVIAALACDHGQFTQYRIEAAEYGQWRSVIRQCHIAHRRRPHTIRSSEFRIVQLHDAADQLASVRIIGVQDDVGRRLIRHQRHHESLIHCGGSAHTCGIEQRTREFAVGAVFGEPIMQLA